MRGLIMGVDEKHIGNGILIAFEKAEWDLNILRSLKISLCGDANVKFS